MRHNPQPLHIRGRRVSILQGRHAVGGPFATVMDYFIREDTPWLVLQLPDGRRTAAPATQTDLPADTFAAMTQRPLLQAAALPEMARLWQKLRPHRIKKRKG
jgi:hypothetical protein